jgi:hypothetical protein
MNVNRWTLLNALDAAAWAYENDAREAGPGRIADQFLRQAGEAREARQAIEQAERINLVDGGRS